MRLRLSGVAFFSHRGFGTTPNMAPPSRKKVPDWRTRTSIAPKCTLAAEPAFREELVHRGEGVFAALGHLRGQRREGGLSPRAGEDALEDAGFEQLQQTAAPAVDLLFSALRGGIELPAEP